MAACLSGCVLVMMVVVVELAAMTGAATFPADVEALKELKSGLSPESITPGSCVASWDFSFDPCDSLFSDHFTCGFRCSAAGEGDGGYSRVTEISLDQAGYAGRLSISGSALPHLEVLDIADNRLSGEIPATVGGLVSLRRLGLSYNSFSGGIPPELGALASLEELFLDNNELAGPIPAALAGLGRLRRLELQSNQLSGELPGLGGLKALAFLHASDNLIAGQLPVSLPPSLSELSIRNNNISGRIPAAVASIQSLQVLDLSHNDLDGAVPAGLFHHPSLQQLTISHNGFTELQTPPSFGLRSNLIAMDVSNNKLHGMLPIFPAMMPKLSALSLENNQFTGPVPAQYAIKTVYPSPGVSPLLRLLLGGNYLFGPIPDLLMGMKDGAATVSLADNCLFRCPEMFFFCRGGRQKTYDVCRSFNPVIPIQ